MQLTQPIRRRAPESSESEEGFLLVAMIFAVAVILIFLAVAAPSVAKDLQREREIETQHRGNQYVRAIRLYYRKFGHYPGSIDELVKSNNIRFLREKYIDPMTGKDDWRIIHVGENKTTVTGFFGQPLAGLSTSGGLGSANGLVSTTGGGSGTPAGGAGNVGCNTGTSGAAFGNSTFGSTDCATPSTGTSGASGSTGASGASGSSGIGSTDATTFGGGGGPIMGVSSLSPKTSIIEMRKQTTYDTWEFIYDPKIEALYKGNPLGGSVGSSSGGNGFGQSIGIGMGASGSTGSTGASGGSSGSGSGSAFGSGGSSFGGSSGGSNSPFSSH